MDKITELERQLAQVQWRLRGLERERSLETFRLRLQLAAMDERLLILREELALNESRICELEAAVLEGGRG